MLESRTGGTLIASHSLMLFAYVIACTLLPLYIYVRLGSEIVRQYGPFII